MFLVLLGFFPFLVFARADLYISPAEIPGRSETYSAGQRIEARAMVDTRGRKVSVVEGSIRFPAKDLKVVSVSKDNSILNLWVEEPKIVGNTISFVGGVPKGFSGTGELFSISFETLTDKTVNVEWFDKILTLSYEANPKNILSRAKEAWYPFKIPKSVPIEHSFNQELIEGNRNKDVAYLQLCLEDEGVFTKNVTGSFGNATKEAIIKFQEKYLGAGEGFLDEATRGELDKRCKKEEIIPEQLFDINLEIDNSAISSIKDLVARVVFISFGRVPTPVDLTFVILDEEGKEVYRDEGEDVDIIVETEAIKRKTFEMAEELPVGKYTLVLYTLYNVGVFDEFRQDFEIKEEKKSFFKTIWFWIIFITLLVVATRFIVVLSKRRKQKENS